MYRESSAPHPHGVWPYCILVQGLGRSLRRSVSRGSRPCRILDHSHWSPWQFTHHTMRLHKKQLAAVLALTALSVTSVRAQVRKVHSGTYELVGLLDNEKATYGYYENGPASDWVMDGSFQYNGSSRGQFNGSCSYAITGTFSKGLRTGQWVTTITYKDWSMYGSGSINTYFSGTIKLQHSYTAGIPNGTWVYSAHTTERTVGYNRAGAVTYGQAYPDMNKDVKLTFGGNAVCGPVSYHVGNKNISGSFDKDSKPDGAFLISQEGSVTTATFDKGVLLSEVTRSETGAITKKLQFNPTIVNSIAENRAWFPDDIKIYETVLSNDLLFYSTKPSGIGSKIPGMLTPTGLDGAFVIYRPLKTDESKQVSGQLAALKDAPIGKWVRAFNDMHDYEKCTQIIVQSNRPHWIYDDRVVMEFGDSTIGVVLMKAGASFAMSASKKSEGLILAGATYTGKETRQLSSGEEVSTIWQTDTYRIKKVPDEEGIYRYYFQTIK